MVVSNSITVINSMYEPHNQLMAFADTNALLEVADQTGQGFLHFWTTQEPTVILGINDKRVPNLAAGLTSLTDHGYHYFLRNSGGLAVVSDPGVLNISVILPISQPLSVDEGYDVMTDLIRTSLPELTIKTGEISDSYCPGTYDLSVNGQKIAGIAQRRTKHSIALMLYLSVNGDQQKRGNVVKAFYDMAQADYADGQFPLVNPDVMTTLANLETNLTATATIKQRIVDTLNRQKNILPANATASLLASNDYQQAQANALQKMQLRNATIAPK